MGDASITTEKEILNKYNLPDIGVLKVGHHGSNASSSKNFNNVIQKVVIAYKNSNNDDLYWLPEIITGKGKE